MPVELTAPVLKQDEERRIVYGPVLVPDEPDSDGDVVSKEKIEEVAHKFMEAYGNIDLQHSLNNVGRVVESYILPMNWEIAEGYTIPAGSWMMGVKVQDDDTWELVKEGRLTGFSIMAVSKVVLKSAEKADEKAYKRMTLADFEKQGLDWVVNAVSLVDEPAVPKAKFIAIKSAKKEAEDAKDDTVEKSAKAEKENSKVIKAIEGSYEQILSLIRNKVYATFDSNITESYVIATFPDRVIIRLENMVEGTTRHYQLGYTITETGEVQFTTQAEEVIIREVVEPIEKHASNSSVKASNSSEKQEGNIDILPKQKQGLFDKIKGLLGKSQKEGEEDMDMEKVEALIDQKMKAIEDKVNEILNTLKGSDAEQEKQEDTTEQAEKGLTADTVEAQAGDDSTAKEEPKQEETQDDDVVPKSQYDELLKQIETLKKRATLSRRITGQDGMDVSQKKKQEEPWRDAFGYRIKPKN